MADQIGDMTRSELRIFVESVVDERLRMRTRPYRQQSSRPLSEVLSEMRQIRIKRHPGEPSVVEMIRADRDR